MDAAHVTRWDVWVLHTGPELADFGLGGWQSVHAMGEAS